MDAAARAYEDWIASRGGMGSAESSAQVAQVRRFIEAYGESRFDPIAAEADARSVLNRAGWRREYGENREWLVLPEVWKEVCAGLDPSAVARLLADLGMLHRDERGNKLQRSERTPFGTKRVYVLNAQILEDGSSEG